MAHGMELPVLGAEAWAIFVLGFPTMVRCYFTCMADRLTLGFVGHYDKVEAHIASAAFGKMYSNVTGFSVGIGIALGLNTYASQNHGRNASAENGVVLRHCLRLMMVGLVFAFAAAALSPPLLRMLGQPLELGVPCQQFSLIQALGLLPCFGKEALLNILASQTVVAPGMFCDIVASSTNLAMGYALLRGGVGYLGSAWAYMVSMWISFGLLILYILYGRLQGTVWKLQNHVSSLGQVSLGAYALTMLPSAFSLWSEWWAAEVLSILAGLLPGGEASVGGHGILMNTLAIFYMTFVGVQSATTTRVGNLVGARDASRIPHTVAGGVLLAFSLSGATAAALYVWSPSLLRLWTDDPDILSEAEGAILGMVLSVPPYSVMMCLLGVLRGAGLQARGALAVFVSFYIFGLPGGAYLGLHCGLGLLGVWWGNVIGLSLSAAGMGAVACCINWNQVIATGERSAECREVSGPLRADRHDEEIGL